VSTLASKIPVRREWLARAATRIEAFPVPVVLGALVLVEWVAVLALALAVRHSGWVYYQGGDQLWLYTLGWLLGHGELGQSPVGYGWPAVLAPIARIAGPNLVSALPVIVLLNVLVLLPAAMLALYGIAARIGGRLFGYWALIVWIAVPFIGIAYTNVGYHQRYTELLLPQAFGLTGLADFPTMVATLVAIYFCARDVLSDRPQLLDALAAGVAGGAAVAIKPSTALFLAGPALAFAYRRRFTSAGLFVLGMAPALLALGLWKSRGLGYLPVFGSALAPHPVAAGGTLTAVDVSNYLNRLDWNRFTSNLDLLREHFWSGRLLEWLVLAGLIGLGRRSRTALLLTGGWLAAFVIVKGSAASVEDGSVFRMLMPAFPAFVLLLASLPLLVPHVPRRLSAWREAFPGPSPRVRRGFVAAAIAVSAVVPLAAFAVATPRGGTADAASVAAGTPPVPVNVDLGVHAAVRGKQVLLDWHGNGGFYRVWRGRPAGGDGFTCDPASPGARQCLVSLPEVGVTHDSHFSDRPPPGRWVYRVAVAANWLNDPQYGDVYLVSLPIAVHSR
jgi:hypothetical protein